MARDEKARLLDLTLFAVLLLSLSVVSCTPMLVGQAALEGTKAVASAAYAESTEDADKNFKNSVRVFNEAFKFEDYVQASALVSPGKKEEFWSEADRFKGKIRLTEYELREIQFDEKKLHATVILHFQYWRTESPTLKGASLSQKWQYSEKDKTWNVSNSGFEAIPSDS